MRRAEIKPDHIRKRQSPFPDVPQILIRVKFNLHEADCMHIFNKDSIFLEHDALRAKKQNQNPGAAPLDPPWGAVKSKSKSK
ncbi:MAG TPA: hypothetical protein HPQ00_15755 [Magnetococcales bacterium]|nr:hypothetical protein [Magnetococcales bacterium]